MIDFNWVTTMPLNIRKSNSSFAEIFVMWFLPKENYSRCILISTSTPSILMCSFVSSILLLFSISVRFKNKLYTEIVLSLISLIITKCVRHQFCKTTKLNSTRHMNISKAVIFSFRRAFKSMIMINSILI